MPAEGLIAGVQQELAIINPIINKRWKLHWGSVCNVPFSFWPTVSNRQIQVLRSHLQDKILSVVFRICSGIRRLDKTIWHSQRWLTCQSLPCLERSHIPLNVINITIVLNNYEIVAELGKEAAATVGLPHSPICPAVSRSISSTPDGLILCSLLSPVPTFSFSSTLSKYRVKGFHPKEPFAILKFR